MSEELSKIKNYTIKNSYISRLLKSHYVINEFHCFFYISRIQYEIITIIKYIFNFRQKKKK